MLELRFEVPKNYFIAHRNYAKWKHEYLVEAALEPNDDDDSYNTVRIAF